MRALRPDAGGDQNRGGQHQEMSTRPAGSFHRAKKRPPFPKGAASFLPLFPDFHTGGVGGVGPDGQALVSPSKPESWEGAFAAPGRPGLPDTPRPFTRLPPNFEGLPHKSFAKEEARWPSMGSAASPKTSFAPCWT